jgi:diacylglycerol kinase family enzyme
MKHLFIINPKVRKLAGQLDTIVEEIRTFFLNYPQIQYAIHITRWRRDAEGFTRRYADGAAEIVRIYAVGGMGTFFEVINGAAGLPNVQVTLLPFGIENVFLHYFGKDTEERFLILRNMVFSQCISFDLIRCGSKLAAGFCLIGVEAVAAVTGRNIIEHLGLLSGKNIWTAAIYFFIALYQGSQKKNIRHYRLDIDGNSFSGDYTSIIIANQPHLGAVMYPAEEARPDDGILDIYVIKPSPSYQRIQMSIDYIKGRYAKWPRAIQHYQGKRISIVSDLVMPMCLDGEMFFNTNIQVEVVPHGMDFTGPLGGDAGKVSLWPV